MDWFGKGIMVGLIVALGAFFGGGWYTAGFIQGGTSMDPAVADGARVFVNYKAWAGGEPKRGQLVVFRPVGEEGLLLRRVIGLPGETIEINNSELIINGQKVPEPWLDVVNAPPKVENPSPEWFPATTVPAGAFFVLADSRKGTKDSRTFGAIPRERILGRAWTLFGMTF